MGCLLSVIGLEGFGPALCVGVFPVNLARFYPVFSLFFYVSVHSYSYELYRDLFYFTQEKAKVMNIVFIYLSYNPKNYGL